MADNADMRKIRILSAGILALGLFLADSVLFGMGKMDSEIPDEISHDEQDYKGNPFKKISPKYRLKKPSGKPAAFYETWGYVSQKYEDEYDRSSPLTDVCYFAADVNCYGELISIPDRSKIHVDDGVRVHFVAICDSRSLTHFVISPEFPVRNRIIGDIIAAAEEFDGIQLDFELVPLRDSALYLDFISEVKARAGEKMISVCVPARLKRLSEDVYPYSEIAAACDRVIVMAYDEHWSGSKPGPVASTEWCGKVADYAVSSIPPEKLVMGIPFYGRTWADTQTAGAWYFSGANRIMTENGVVKVEYEDDVPRFSYRTEVGVTGYFNDAYSVLALCRLYESRGVRNVGFWRIGHEDPEFWKWLEIR